MIEAKTIKSSIGQYSPRLVTMRCISPKFIHQESLRHRKIYIHDLLAQDPDFSFSVSSARAIPFSKLLEEVRSDTLRAAPEFWGCEQKGMSPGDELSDDAKILAQYWWREAALSAADYAEKMANAAGAYNPMPWDIPHKSIINRIIEPYIHVHALMTATEPGWMNFFGLRLDQAADKTLQALAQACWKEWNEVKPEFLNPDQWHLPYIDNAEVLYIIGKAAELECDSLELMRKVSAARCARLSYDSFATKKRSTIEEDLELYNRLVGGLIIHASPVEHQATPDSRFQLPEMQFINNQHIVTGYTSGRWIHEEEQGNLGPGWRQARKMIPHEAIAPLPIEYQR